MTARASVASLPMYDWPEVRWAHDALWAAIAARLREAGIAAPGVLDRSRPSEDIWRDPDLVLSQTCGYPYSTRLIGRVRLVGTPVYAVEGCAGSNYSSAIVASRDKAGKGFAALAARRVAFNAPDSLSGYVALRAAMRAARIDPAAAEWIETGSHRESLRAVAAGRADLAALDAVCWALAKQHEADAVATLDVVCWTPKRPGLPFITAGRRVGAVLDAVSDALADPETASARSALFITGVAGSSEADYVSLASLNG